MRLCPPERVPTMVYSVPHFISQIAADARQPGYQGPLEIISFVIISAMVAGAFLAATVLLIYAI
jgi:hypothetical protein